MKKIKLTEQEYDAALLKEYLKGYKEGFRYGKKIGFSKQLTPNDIRELLGLPKIEK